jgi:N-acetylmuramoyl-L-alanine amidase
MNIGKKEIDTWHRQKGWLKIGYHYVIKRDGEVETGRELNEVGAHVQGLNEQSLGICMVGGVDADNEPENNFTEEQFESLKTLLYQLLITFPDAEIKGHRNFAPKACPSFDVEEWWKQQMTQTS